MMLVASEMKSGERISERFEAKRLVGAGGMGQVFWGRDLLSGEDVAVKTLLALSESGQERFAREARLLAQLRHPGLVRYVAHGQHEGMPYLVMEWLDGEDLSCHLRECQTESTVGLGLAEVLSIGRRIAGALGELHQRGIVHRDVKPGNIFLVDKSAHQAKLLDLGVARQEESRLRITIANELVGSPCYMAPEQADGQADIGPAADVWALGCVLYECLTGRPPFHKNHTLALLASIALDDPVPPSQIRPDTPPELEAFVLKMLSKKVQKRFRDAGELLDALSRFSVSSLPSHDSPTRTQPSRGPDRTHESRPSLTSMETRVSCVLLVGLSVSMALPLSREIREGFDCIVSSYACDLRQSFDTTRALLVIPRQGLTPKEQAQNLARVALALRRIDAGLSSSLVTVREHSEAEVSLGSTVERAAVELSDIGDGEVVVDEASAAFLETRFDLRQNGPRRLLSAERHAEGVRTLLGRITPWVGRQREMNLLLDTYHECRDEREARVLLVTAEAGMGKTRLRHEVVQALVQEEDGPTILHCQGDALSSGSPFVMLGPALRRLAGVLDGELLEERRRKWRARASLHLAEAEAARVCVFLGEMIGIPFDDMESESLRAAREDPALLRDATRAAFVDWLRAECAEAPVLVVLEDLHWGDLPSVQYLDSALAALADCPLMVLALARPELRSAFPSLWQQHNIVELRLHRLSKRASSELVRTVLGPDLAEPTVRCIVEKADGNAFYLEELIRFASEGRLEAVPDNVLAMVQTRLDELDQEARRVLRAASIFGEVFWEDGVRTLIGEAPGTLGQRTSFGVSEWLRHLCDWELIRQRPTSRLPGQSEYQFRHALVHDAAHEMLTETDSRVGHELAGTWLLHAGEQDSLVLAEHFSRGGQAQRAIEWFRLSAEQAFEGSDFSAATLRCERAISLGANGEALGKVRALQAQTSYWESDYEHSKRCGQEALAHLLVGSQEWFRALGSTVVAAARVGDTDLLNQLFERALSTVCHSGAEAAQLVCLCRGAFQLIFGAKLREADAALLRIDEIAAGSSGLDLLTVAQVHHVRGVRAAHRANVGTFLGHLETAIASFEAAGDVRNVCLERTTVAWCQAELGQLELARSLSEENLVFCQTEGANQALTYAKVNLGYILSLSSEHQVARALLQEAIFECEHVGNKRLEGWARAHLSRVEHEDGCLTVAENLAESAVDLLRATPGLQAWARACLARTLLALGRSEDALECATQAMRSHAELGGLLQGDALVPVVLAECLHERGAREDAICTIRNARGRLVERARQLPRPEWRESFWGLPDSLRTNELCRSWAGDDT